MTGAAGRRERTVADSRFAALVGALGNEAGVSVGAGGTGFGAGTLQVEGRIFAMVSAGRLVLKLPARRVAELLDAGEGLPFDAGKGRPMKEWVALDDGAGVPYASLAREALAFVGKRPGSGVTART
jgi:hypothetical protein